MVRYLAWKKIKALLNIQRYQRGPQAGILGKGCENFVVRVAPGERKFYKSSFFKFGWLLYTQSAWDVCVCGCVFSLIESYPVPCSSMNCSPPGSSVHGDFLARLLEWVAISSSRGSSGPRDQPASPASPALVGGFFTSAPQKTFSLMNACWVNDEVQNMNLRVDSYGRRWVRLLE